MTAAASALLFAVLMAVLAGVPAVFVARVVLAERMLAHTDPATWDGQP